jgi:hypothetical protein
MAMRAWSVGIAAVTMCVFPISAAFSAGGGALEVAQPLVGGEGIEVSRVSYVMGAPYVLVPGYNVYLVGEPSCVCDGQGKSVNRNAASFLGIKAGYDPYHAATSKLHGDTLHVFMDLSELRPAGPELDGFSVDAVVKATVQSILLTAYECRAAISEPDTGLVDAKYVWLEIRGSDEYSGLGGVFTFDKLAPTFRKRLFQ